jgi:hypothetical protein
MFNLIRLGEAGETHVLVRKDGHPRCYRTGKQAARVAQHASKKWGCKVQPRRVPNVDWRKRERERFTDGTYLALPWACEPWWNVGDDHFAHVSRRYPGKVAYTTSPDKGLADIQTPIKPGRYLEQFCKTAITDYIMAHRPSYLRKDCYQIADTVIKEWAEHFAASYEETELHFATTADEIEKCYMEGPNTCMSYQMSSYGAPFRPIRIYASEDLAVAYIMRNNKIVARSLCWPAKKRHSAIYGDVSRMKGAFQIAGYQEASLQGARLIRHEFVYDGSLCLVMPYIDNDGYVTDDGEVLKIGSIRGYGHVYTADDTSGLLRLREATSADRKRLEEVDLVHDEDECDCDECRAARGEDQEDVAW